MAIMRMMFVGEGPSGLPEDRVINTWHFSNTDEYEAHRGLVAVLLMRMYSGEGGLLPGMTRPIGEWLSPWVQRAAKIVSYDLNTAIPRIPTDHPIQLPPPLSTVGLPEEVACCLSLKAQDPPFSARRRGRLYIGPLNNGAANQGSAVEPSRPTQPFVDDLLAGAEHLINTANVDWMIRSTRPSQNFVRIGGAWVDNAWDTQRRRGPVASARTEVDGIA